MNHFVKRLLCFMLCVLMIGSVSISVAATEATDETRGPEKAKPGIYDFVLEEQYVWIDRDRFSGKSPHSELVKRAMEAYYEDGTLNWKVAADNIEFMQSENVWSSPATAFGSTPDYKWRGLRMGAVTKHDGNKAYPSGYWYAFTLKAPEPGLYDVNLDFMYRDDGAKVAEVYFLDFQYSDAILIDRELTTENLIGTVDFSGKSEDGKTYLPSSARVGTIDIMEDEITLVFRADEKVSDTACCYMVISGINLTPSEGAAEDLAPSDLQPKSNTTLFVIIGAAAFLAVVAVVIVVAVGKKKKK